MVKQTDKISPQEEKSFLAGLFGGKKKFPKLTKRFTEKPVSRNFRSSGLFPFSLSTFLSSSFTWGKFFLLKKKMSCLIFWNMFVCLFHIVSLSVTLQLTSLVDRTCDLTWNTEDFQNKTPLWGIITVNLNCYCCFSSVEASLTTASTTTAHTATTTRTATTNESNEARRSPAPSANRTSASPTGHTETQLKNKSDDFITLYLSGDMTVWDSLM